jgi:type IV secretion system protein VirB9
MTRAAILAISALSLAACATPPAAIPPEPLTSVRAEDTSPVAAELAELVDETVPESAPAQEPEPDLEPQPEAPLTPEPASMKPERVSAPPQSLAEVNRAARQGATNATYEDATLVYAYAPGALYELQTSPSYISTILLEPGETVLDIASGDTNRWMVSQTLTGTGETGRTLIIVKPLAAKLKTNIVLATDRRAYLIEAVSVSGDTYTAQVAWSYPKSPVPEAPPPPPPPPPPVLNYDFDITPPWRKAPVWTPVSVWDDGRKTWIAFSSNVAAADMPPLFVRTGEGLELVNYRVEGQTYVVDRLFDRGELRLGQKKPVVVRIDRQKAARP